MNTYKVAALAAAAGIAATLTFGFASTNDAPAPVATEQPVTPLTAEVVPVPDVTAPENPTPLESPLAPPSANPTSVPTVPEAPVTVKPPIDEDSPEWDCRTMGNLTCGVQIQGTWYNITFANGSPVSIKIR